jgi:phosphatidylserine/phosphatidylglycerophosphate/cardiolipin synthase-like enzyme
MVKKTTLAFLFAISLILPSSVFAQAEADIQTFDDFSSFYSNSILGDAFNVSVDLDIIKEAVAPAPILTPLKIKTGDFSSFPNYAFAYLNDITIDALNASQKSIDIVMYSIYLKEMPEAIIKARDRGVKVRMIIDQFHVYPRMSDQIKQLIEAGIEIRTLRGTRDYGVMHNKIGIFDNKMLTTGSYNWTFSATFYNHENMLLTQNPIYVKGFKRYWDWMWEQSNTLAQGEQSKFPVGYFGSPPEDKNPVMKFNGLTIPAYIFSPGGQSEERLAAIIGAAKKTVDAVTFTFSSKILADAVIAAKDRGVKVRFMTDSGLGKTSWAAKLIFENGVEMRWRKGRTTKGAMHNKYVILDGKLLQTGSFNWSVNGNINSFENMIFINDAQAVKDYQSMFDGFYAEATNPVIEDFEDDIR